jgi:hypothetical protein
MERRTVPFVVNGDVESERDFSLLHASTTLRGMSPQSFSIEKLGLKLRYFNAVYPESNNCVYPERRRVQHERSCWLQHIAFQGGFLLILATAHLCYQVQINI